MGKRRFFQVTQNGISLLLILLFAYVSFGKLADHRLFQLSLSKSPLLQQWSAIISWVIPALEGVIVVLLILPKARKAGLAMSAVLLALFTAYIGYMILFVPHLPCSCGGVLKQLSWPAHLLLNIGLTALASWGLYVNIRLKKLLQ